MTVVSLSDVCELTMGQAPKGDTYNETGDGYPLVAGAGDFGELYPSPKKFTSGANVRLAQPGDIILAIRASIGSKVMADDVYCLGRGVAGLRPGPKLDYRYLWNWLSHAAPTLVAKGRGATFLQVNKQDVAEMQINLPSLEEQKRIAGILDAADQLRTKRQQTIDRLSTLQAALFNKTFCVEKSSDWPIVPLGDLISTTSGGTPSRKEPMFFQGEIPWVKSGEVKGRLVMESEEKISFEALTNSSAKLMPAGTVLLAMYGATVGAVSILGIEATTNQAVCCLTPTDQILGSYLADYLRSKTPELKRMAAGGAQPNISQQVVRQVPLLLAPIDAQNEYKLALEGIATAQSLSASSFENFDKLFNSLQQRAFRGDL